MTRQIVLRHPSLNRRQPLLTSQSPTPKARFAEVAGGTTAECAAICCCCPCGLLNLLILAVYKLPAGLCKKALKKKKGQRAKKTGLLLQRRSSACGGDETEKQVHPVAVDMLPIDKLEKPDSTAKEVSDLEKEMWERFHSTGFWRSPSQREE